MDWLMIAGIGGRVLVFILGVWLVLRTLVSATVSFVLPRSAPDPITRVVFLAIRRIFDLRTSRVQTYAERDRAMALYAPISLLALPPVWLLLVGCGFSAMFWASGVGSPEAAFKVSGSSLLTLGFATVDSLGATLLAFIEASIGLVLVALLIAYLPTMYAAFARRETAVTLLEVRAGSPPSAIEMFLRYQRIHNLGDMGDLWATWEVWFADVEESHTSLAALSFFRSPQPDRSWVTAAGTILDAAALAASTLDIPHDPRADLCIRAGYVALHRISDFFGIPYNATPQLGDPISITRAEYDAACAELAAGNVPLKADREQAWRDFMGWRVNYDTSLLALAGLTMAPYAMWSSDRGLRPARAKIMQKQG